MENSMQKVKDVVFYQVATDRDYKVGDKLLFDQSIPNGQYNRVFNSTFLKDGKRLSDTVYDSAKRKFKKFKKTEDIYEIAHALEFYDVITKELAIEEVRQKYFEKYPSRLHCMYLSVSKQIVLDNIKNFANSREKKGKHFQAVAVKLNGTIFKAGKVYMSRQGQSYEYYKQKAYDYWSQQDVQDEEIKEILFEGQAEIVEILDEIKID